MTHSFVPVVLLAIVAVSSSNILPILSDVQLLDTSGIDGQNNDNIISNRFSREYILPNILKELPLDTSQIERLRKRTEIELNMNENPEKVSFDDLIDAEDNYDGEGFRKEQWHNYPRQMDRLHDYLFKHYDTYKQNPDANDPDNTNYNDVPDAPDIHNRNSATNKFVLNDRNNVNKIAQTTNPWYLLQVHLACLHSKPAISSQHPSYDMQQIINEENFLNNDKNPAIKVKRDGKEDTYMQDDDASKERRTVKKRLFSLWSRLQSLSHKGHELPHRRHIHAFYGLPDSAGSGGLSAEIRRDTRPPGAPLRWG